MKRSLLFLGFFAFFSSLAFADDTPGDIVDRKDYDANKPYYETFLPDWSIGFRFTFPNFPYNDGHPALYTVFAEKLLPFQQIGVFSAGVSFGSATFAFNQGIQMLSLGLTARYQLYFMRNQIIVPTAMVMYDNYRIAGSSLNSVGFALGGLLNLGFFDRSSALQGAQSISLLRSYLSAEFRPLMKVTSSGVSRSVGNAIYFGILLELE